MDRTAAFYSQPSYVQRGGGFPVYSGSRRQRGGNIFGALKRLIAPILGNVKNTAVRHAKRQAWNMAKDVAFDAFRGRNIGESLKERGIHHAKQLGKDVLRDTTRSITRPNLRKRKAPAKTVKRTRGKRRKVAKNF